MKTKLLFIISLVCAGLSVSAQDWAKARLEKSPRHGEWVDVTNGSRTVHCFIVYPEVKNPATAVIVIHEIFGLTPWARNAADEVAAAGYIAIPPDQITGDLNAVADYARTLPAANGKLAVAGFCWGGGQSFRFACNRPDLKAAFVFYGPPPDETEMQNIKCPVYGFYGGNDARISATIPATEKLMKAASKTYKPVTYSGAGHGFMRAGEQPDAEAANQKAHDQAWKRLKDLLGKL
jgi:carboxymethylenebutenolidase